MMDCNDYNRLRLPDAIATQLILNFDSYGCPQESDEIWDGTRSFLFFTIDLSLKPAATMSDKPPLDFNCPRIPIDSILTVSRDKCTQTTTTTTTTTHHYV